MPKSIENSQTVIPRHSKRVAVAAGVMAGVSLFGTHPNRASAQKPPKPTPVVRLHKIETQLHKEQLIERKARQETDRLAGAIALDLSQYGVTKDTVKGIGLKNQESLPGAGMKVSPEHQKKLEQATVHIIYRDKGSEEAWRDLCTGTKISYEGQNYVVSARHCYQAAVYNSDISTLETWPAYDFMNSSNYEYAVTQTPGGEPLVHIDGLSMDMNDDWALLRPQVPQKSDTGYDLFNALPVLNYDIPPKTPKIGEQGIIHGYAYFNNFQPTSALVTYIGRYKLPGLESNFQTFDLVAISQKTVAKNGCIPGFSGASIKFAGGSVSGPLVFVRDFGYKDPNQNKLSPFGVRPLDRFVYEQLTGINLERDEAICELSVRSSEADSPKGGTMSGLTDGFNHPVQSYVGPQNNK